MSDKTNKYDWDLTELFKNKEDFYRAINIVSEKPNCLIIR